jgi:hypothetical protein
MGSLRWGTSSAEEPERFHRAPLILRPPPFLGSIAAQEDFGENVPFALPFQKAENDLYSDR